MHGVSLQRKKKKIHSFDTVDFSKWLFSVVLCVFGFRLAGGPK